MRNRRGVATVFLKCRIIPKSFSNKIRNSNLTCIKVVSRVIGRSQKKIKWWVSTTSKWCLRKLSQSMRNLRSWKEIRTSSSNSDRTTSRCRLRSTSCTRMHMLSLKWVTTLPIQKLCLMQGTPSNKKPKSMTSRKLHNGNWPPSTAQKQTTK